MFAFMHPYQTIHRLEQEVATLNAQLDAEKKRHNCRAISLMTPIESLSMLQARGADMLCSLSKGVEVHAQHLAADGQMIPTRVGVNRRFAQRSTPAQR